MRHCIASQCCRSLCTSRITLIDRVEGLAEGRALDIRQSAHLVSTCSLLRGSSDLKDMQDSDFIMISAGAPRKEAMSRLDLLSINREIVLQLGEVISAYAPRAVILIVSNPVDLLTTFFKLTYPRLNVFGFGCSLDSYRYCSFIGEKLNVNPTNVTGVMIGSHDQDMIRYLPVTDLLTPAELDEIRLRTVNAGTEIVRQLKTTGSSLHSRSDCRPYGPLRGR